MSFARKPVILHGRCLCGCIGIGFSTRQEPATLSPRACDCDFCRKHGAAYVSDPGGTLRLTVGDPDAMLSYRQGSGIARFRLCGRCGVLVAVTFGHDGRLYGAVNSACLDERAILGAAVAVSPQSLDPQAKVARWLQAWVPDVQLVVAGATPPTRHAFLEDPT